MEKRVFPSMKGHLNWLFFKNSDLRSSGNTGKATRIKAIL